MEFFDKRIKKLRRIAGGDTCTIIYLKMLLLSLPDEGVLYYDGIEDDFAEEIALELDEETENVRMTITYLLSKGLMEKRSKYEYFLYQVPEMLGREDESASRQRKRREKMAEKRDNVTQLSDNVAKSRDIVQKCHTEIDIEKDKEIELHSDIDIDCDSVYKGECNNVILLDWQWKKLKELFPNNYRERVDRLSRYIRRTGKNYPSHYATIVSWAKEDGQINEQTAKTAKEEEKKGSFDTDSFFDAALARSYDGL
ncbi:MAG: phage replisome organizer N-terminal domain-containing protein [Clostridia bacterium]|nr:phage replisome organizer N-terminal domain-containing protein [Clostridia bacterium]